MASESLLCKNGPYDGFFVYAAGDAVIYWAADNKVVPNGPMTTPRQIRDAEGFYVRGSVKVGRAATKDILMWSDFK